MEDSHSGRVRTLGKRVKGNLSRVQIPHSPPVLLSVDNFQGDLIIPIILGYVYFRNSKKLLCSLWFPPSFLLPWLARRSKILKLLETLRKNRLVELRFPWHTSPPTLKNSKTLELSKLTQTQSAISHFKICGQPSITESHTRELWKMGSGNLRQRLNQLKLFPCDAVPKLILSNEQQWGTWKIVNALAPGRWIHEFTWLALRR